ncbi:MAG TPA: PKD domain-containing protein, partial [Aquabacterium sp.]|nr:PKD domain-containing protein [Aquabacterium sp.]
QFTCGAGMLDVDQAVQFALTQAAAVISRVPDDVQPGQPVQFSGSQSMASPGASTIVSYHWTLLDGGGIVNSTGWSANTSPLVVTPTAVGKFEIRLTVVDDQGRSASSDQWIVVGQPGTSNTAAANSSGGGGGSVSAFDLLVLASFWAMISLRPPRRTITASASTPRTRRS